VRKELAGNYEKSDLIYCENNFRGSGKKLYFENTLNNVPLFLSNE
jgi:hypothetical protein